MHVSIDVGGTNTRVAGASDLLNPVFRSEPLRRKNAHDFELDLKFMVEAALRLADGEPIEAVGIGTPGSPNEDKSGIKSAQNLSSWVGMPLVSSLSTELDCQVFYDNDGVAAGLGEAHYGQTKGNFDYLIWGTGIGGAAIRHIDSIPMVSGLNWQEYFANWENDCGGAKIAEAFGKPPEELTATEWELISRDFNQHLKTFVDLRKPETIVFAGGLAVRHTDMVKSAGKNLGTQINVTEFGDDSGLMGGFALIRRGLGS